MKIKGKTWKFGNDVDTDAIIPARYLNTTSAKELAAHCMEDADPGVRLQGSSREILSRPEKTSAAAHRGNTPR